MVFIRSTSQCNMQRRTCCGRHRKHWIETPIKKKIQYINASFFNLMSCIDLYIIEKVYSATFFSIHCVNTGGLKLNFEKGKFNPMFSMTSAHCTVTSMSWLWQMRTANFQSFSPEMFEKKYIVSRAVKRDFGEPSKIRQVSSAY